MCSRRFYSSFSNKVSNNLFTGQSEISQQLNDYSNYVEVSEGPLTIFSELSLC